MQISYAPIILAALESRRDGFDSASIEREIGEVLKHALRKKDAERVLEPVAQAV